MKTLLLLLLTVAPAVWGQDEEALCKCDATIELLEGEIDVLILPVVVLTDCNQIITCATSCREQWTLATNDGDLYFVMEDGTTVGQHMCDNLNTFGHPTITPHTAYVYYNVCQGPWIYDGLSTQQEICCQDGTHISCV